MGIIIFLFAIGLSFIIIVVTVRGKYRKAGLWFSLALIGQAAALQLIFAGPKIHYQHYRIGADLYATPYLYFLSIVILQAFLVGWGVLTGWREILTCLSTSFKPWQIGLLTAVFVFSSAALSRVYTDYLFEILFAALVQLINLATVLLGVFSIPKTGMERLNQKIARFFGDVEDRQFIIHPQIGRFGLFLAVWVFTCTACLSGFIYQRHPHVQDEVLYLYQARYLSQGMFTTPAPPVPEGFSIYMIPYKSSRWYSPFPPGWPALLGFGELLKIPWLINPFLAGINVLLCYLLFQFVLPIRYARLSTLLLSASPWFLFMGMNFMSHTFMLTCTLAAGWMAVLALKSGKPAWGVLAGVFIGILSLIRPMDSIVVGGLLGMLLLLYMERTTRMKAFIGYLVGAFFIAALVLPYNRQVTGDALKMPLNSYYEDYYGSNTYALGFGQDRGIAWAIDPLPGYSPVEAVFNAALNTFSVNIELFGWSTGSLFLAALFLIWGYRFFTRLDYFFIAAIIVTIGAYALFWFSGGPDFGARYWYLLIFPLIYLTARCIQIIEQRDGTTLNKTWGPRVVFTALVLSVGALFIYLPWRSVDKYYHYLEMSPDIRKLSQELNFGNSLVLIQGSSHPDYESAWVYNPLDLQAQETIFAFDRDPTIREKIVKAYADRPIWVLQGPTITGDTYRVIAGPLSAQEAINVLR